MRHPHRKNSRPNSSKGWRSTETVAQCLSWYMHCLCSDGWPQRTRIRTCLCWCVWVSARYQGFMLCQTESGSRCWELGERQERLYREIILRHAGDVISAWIISVQWHASAPLDFALVWGTSPCIRPKLDICQMPVLYSRTTAVSCNQKVDSSLCLLSLSSSTLAVFTSGLRWQPWQGYFQIE